MRLKDEVKNLTLDDIYKEQDYFDEHTLPEEDLIKLDEGEVFVYDTLGKDIALKKKEIREALWNFYYDYDKTIVWALDELTRRADKEMKKEEEEKEKKKKKKTVERRSRSNEQEEKFPYASVESLMKEVGYLRIGYQDIGAEYSYTGLPVFKLAVMGFPQSGKSTLMGRLLCDLNQIPESIYNDLNRKKEENTEVQFDYASVVKNISNTRFLEYVGAVQECCFQTSRYEVYFTDHENNSYNLLRSTTLVSEADAALILVDASSTDNPDESYVLPRDIKHNLNLTRFFGVRKLLFAVNKMDSIGWSESRFKEIKYLLERQISHFGLGKNDYGIVPVSGLTGDNLIYGNELQELRSWYTGSSLMEQINKLSVIEYFKKMPLRIHFSGIVSEPEDKIETNTVKICGVVQSGEVSIGEKIILVPGTGQYGIIKDMVGLHGSEKAHTLGYRIFTIEGFEADYFTNGSVLCRKKEPIQPIQSCVANIIVAYVNGYIRPESYVVLQIGDIRHNVYIRKILEAVEVSTGHIKTTTNPNGHAGLNYGMSGKVEIHFPGYVIPLEKSKDRRNQKSIFLKDNSNQNLAIGVIEQFTPASSPGKYIW